MLSIAGAHSAESCPWAAAGLHLGGLCALMGGFTRGHWVGSGGISSLVLQVGGLGRADAISLKSTIACRLVIGRTSCGSSDGGNGWRERDRGPCLPNMGSLREEVHAQGAQGLGQRKT